MSSWKQHLEDLRTRELEAAFRNCPDKLFPNALELGAGSGFQSSLLIRYAEHLIATELNAERFNPEPHPGVEYQICDAEQVGEVFAPHSFHLIFASNLLEHVPDPERALRGMQTVLAPGGIVILIMPNALWKTFSLLGFYPNMIRLAWRALRRGRMRRLWARYATRSEDTAQKSIGNNLKSAVAPSVRAGVLWPVPHGAYPSHLQEFVWYRKAAWLKRFKEAGFRIVTVRKGPVSSGYGFGNERLRRLIEKIGLTTEFIYVLSMGEDSPYAAFWEESSSGRE